MQNQQRRELPERRNTKVTPKYETFHRMGLMNDIRERKVTRDMNGRSGRVDGRIEGNDVDKEAEKGRSGGETCKEAVKNVMRKK